MNNNLTPYQEWLVLRRLVKNNNLSIRFSALMSKINVEDLPEVYKTIGENFVCKDSDAVLIYEDYCKKDWIDKLSRNDLFKLYNFQNKILKMSNNRFTLSGLDYFSFIVSNNYMDIFGNKIEFTGKPQKQDKDNKHFIDDFEYNIIKTLVSNYERTCSEYENSHEGNKLKIIPIGDLNGFEFGKNNEEVKKVLNRQREEERKKQELEERKKSETPIFPEFEEFFKEYDKKNNYKMYDEFIK